MRKIKEIFRLKWDCGLSNNKIARSCNIARSTVAEYFRRAQAAGISWPLPEGMDEGRLERLLFPPPPSLASSERPLPEWAEVHRELRRKDMTLSLLWQEYQESCTGGYQYSRFCDLYRRWAGRLDLSMRQEHKAGEKTFVDYAGPTVPVNDRASGEIREAQIFVAVLGASNYTYAEATWTQQLPDWIGSHTRAFTFFGGITELVIHDNLKSGVKSPCRYEPEMNPTYHDLIRHYGMAAIPARVRKPKDNAKAEAGVQLVERWILARLRHRSFFSLTELNEAIRELLGQLNEKPFKKLPGSRRSLFETLDRPALKPLPPEPYVYAEWLKARVHIDYHIEADKHYYSVPYQLYRQQLDVRLTARTVECFHKGRRVASHRRSHQAGRHTTLKEHMPKAHRSYAEWTPERIVRWARKAGEATVQATEAILASRLHPQQAFRSCLGVMRLGKVYGEERLEAACRRALRFETLTYKSIQSILKHGLDRQQLPEAAPAAKAINHPNIRGSHYYEGEGSC
jgi:transposase